MVKLGSTEDGLVFRVCEHTPDVVRQVLLERGWTEYDESEHEDECEWNLWWKTQRFKKSEHADVASWQRLNHFPRTNAITRKDCLVRNFRRMRCVHGVSAFDFHPLSYILPNEYTKFVSDYARESQKGKNNTYWICKPTDLSRGRGIFVFKDLKDLNYDCPVIVQKYISSPFLISGYKFDLRIYVCVPSFQPLTIYIYQEGIVRFSTDKFDLDQLGNVYSHLTNTSINKYGPAFSADKERVGPGCKWTLSQLRHFLHQMDDIDETLLWQRITNIVVLTLAAQAPTVPKSQSCFEVFGFDILIDRNFKPWLLEVNFSPALSMDCQADFIAKRSMLNDLVDLLNFQPGDAERGGEAYRERNRQSPLPRRRFSFGKNAQTGKNRRHPQVAKSVPPLGGKTGVDTYKSNESLLKTRKNREAAVETDITTSDTPAGPLPRNFSACSLASSLSSGDSRDRSVSEDFPVGPRLEESKPSRTRINGRTGPVPPIRRKRQSLDGESGGLTSRSLPGLDFSSLSPGGVALPKIQSCRSGNFKSNSGVSLGLSNDTLEETKRSDHEIKTRPHSRGARCRVKVAPDWRQPLTSVRSDALGGVKPSYVSARRKSLGKYQSPYGMRNTAASAVEKSSSAWPRTRVGDFVLAFPLSETTRKASGANFDSKAIIREISTVTKRLASKNAKANADKRKKSAAVTKSEAIELSFMLKFEDRESNPLYFWGPQHPPLLSSVLS